MTKSNVQLAKKLQIKIFSHFVQKDVLSDLNRWLGESYHIDNNQKN